MAQVDLYAAQQQAGSLVFEALLLPVPLNLGRLEFGFAFALQHE
jgi:hypothetical protein